ncbi:hypothetical protein [Hydrocarboniphaga daqingensis]|uniref:hypothetical protein n=1 Tax=Hydrocarboniphaga daqingensis TaxID=490188 RepID=UPI001114CE73|nr:hypothetical protein [Hydrocarboniphaga daqingensis]
MKPYVLVSAALGALIPCGALSVSMAFRHTFNLELFFLWPTILFFASDNPDQEMSWMMVAFAVASNSALYAAVCTLIFWRGRS